TTNKNCCIKSGAFKELKQTFQFQKNIIMNKIIFPIYIVFFLMAAITSHAQIIVNSKGQVKINGDRVGDDPNKDLSLQIYGPYTEYLANGRIGFGDYGSVAYNSSNVFIGELGTNWDSDKLQLHGKKGIYLTYDQGYNSNKIIGKFDIAEPDRFKFELDVYAKGILLSSDARFKEN